MQKEAYLVVISVLEGRNFPSRPKHQLVIECKFDGELLATDPTSHIEAPNFTTELAWEMDRKALHQHKMQRTPVKLQCYAVDTATSFRENIGYILLDLRGAQQKVQAAKWYNLLSSKYSRLKPAIKIGMMLEDDANASQPAFKANEAPPRTIQAGSTGAIEATLDEDEGYFQIGPNKQACDMFVLAVTLGSAFNLEQLIYGDKPLPSITSGFFFYYTLFGNDILNDAFHNLLSPDITPERASLRIKSTLDSLNEYFKQNPQLKVHLCCGDQVLGTANVDFSNLFTKRNLTLINTEPVVVDGSYPLISPVKVQDLKAAQSRVNVSVCLRRESISMEAINKTPKESPKKLNFDDEAAPNEPPVKDTNQRPLPFPNLEEDEEAVPKAADSKEKPSLSSEETVNTENDAISIHSDSESIENELPRPNLQPVSDDKSASLTTTETHTDVPSPMQHYRFTLDINTISTSQLSHPCNIYVKYSYPFFGSFSPVLTGSVQVKNNTEVRMPRSKCVFDFACPPHLLSTTFRSFPIVLEAWHKDKETKDVMLGVSSIVLTQILKTDRVKFVSDQEMKGKMGYRQTCHGTIPILNSTKDKIGQLNVVTVLEDFGIVVDQNIIRPPEKIKQSPIKKDVGKKSPKKQPNEDPRQTDEYKTAIELELWKSQEKENFTKRLKEMEVQHLKLLGEEFAKRDKEREALVAKQVAEYQGLEKQLAETIGGLEKREKQVGAAEQELNRMRDDAVREKERAVAEAKEASKRMKEDCIHQVQLERERRGLLEEHNKKLLKQVNELEGKYTALMSQFHDYKNEQSTRPEVRLQAELNLARLEKAEIERKLESVTKSKLHYKQQWGRTLKELAVMKKREQEHAIANLKQQQQELETLKLRYLANDEKTAISSDQDKLKQIQDDLKLIKESKGMDRISSIAIESGQEKTMDHDDINERVSRLIEERDTLLRTGVYSQNDRIITELDRQIHSEMLKQKQ